MDDVGVLPGLKGALSEHGVVVLRLVGGRGGVEGGRAACRWAAGHVVHPYLGEGTVVPQVALVGEAVADISELALLDVLLDGVEELLLGDLGNRQVGG